MKNSQSELINHNAIPLRLTSLPQILATLLNTVSFLAVKARASLLAKSCSKEKFNRKIAETLKTRSVCHSCSCSGSCNGSCTCQTFVYCNCGPDLKCKPQSCPIESLMKLLIMRRMLYFSQFGWQTLSSDTMYVTCWLNAH